MFITRRSLVVLYLVTLATGLGHYRASAWARPDTDDNDGRSHGRSKARSAADALNQWVTAHGGQLSLHVTSANQGQTVAAINSDQPLNPASNTKVLTMAASLRELGPGWRFKTSLSGLIKGGTVDRLVLSGNGDPTLDRTALMGLAYQVVEHKVSTIQRIAVDQSAFDEKFVPPAFEQQPNEWAAFRAPVSAVAFERNTLSILVTPMAAGQAASVSAFPPSYIALVSNVRTVKHGDKLEPLQVTPSAERVGVKVLVRGSVEQASAPVSLIRRIDDPRLYPGYALADCLRAFGINVANVVELGTANREPVLAQRVSIELGSLMSELGKDSDNFTAEMLVKALGAHATARPGTTEDGLNEVRRFAEKVHPLSPGTRLVNGSGLFDANRLSAELLTAVLRHVRTDTQLGPEFVSSLAVAGRDGTLRKRLINQATTAVVRAKTGSLKQAVSLSGYLDTGKTSEPWVFSVIVNGVESTDGVRAKIDEFVSRVIDAMLE